MPQDQASASQDLLVDLEDGVLTLTFNRPDARNAFTPDMLTGMAEALREAEVNRDVGCVVLTGAGSAFCAGGAVKAMAQAHASGAPVDVPVRRRSLGRCCRSVSRRNPGRTCIRRSISARLGLRVVSLCRNMRSLGSA